MHISIRMRRSVAMLGIALLGSISLAGGTNNVPYAEPFTGAAADSAVTNLNGWFTGSSDLSVITNLVDGYSLTGVAYPINDYVHTLSNKVIKLNTEGDTLTNSFLGGTGTSFNNTNMFVDMMVNFVVSEDLPAAAVSNDSNVKAAIFLKADGATTNLYVFHGQKSSVSWGSPAFSPITNGILPGAWYRLTIEMKSAYSGEDPAEAFRVKINGNVLTSTNLAYGDNFAVEAYTSPYYPTNGGSWFLSAARRDGDTGTYLKNAINSVAFQGTGMIDDLVVTNKMPSYAAFSGYPAIIPTSWLSGIPGGMPSSFAGYPDDNDSTGTPEERIIKEWLLNTSPLVSNAVDFAVTCITNSAGNVDVAVNLAITPAALGPIKGTLNLYASESLTNGATWGVADTGGIGATFPHIFNLTSQTESNKFYKAVIE